jgi:predicted Zn-dependent protease with MMP-like domain
MQPHTTALAVRPPSRKKAGMTAPSQGDRWQSAKAPSLDEIERMADDAYRQLPDHFRALCKDLVIRVTEYPTDEVLDAMGIESELDLMGLFQGVGLPFQSESMSGQMPNMVFLYRVPMLLYWAEHDETLTSIVTHVLVHEIGHHFGLSDEDMAAIEASVE